MISIGTLLGMAIPVLLLCGAIYAANWKFSHIVKPQMDKEHRDGLKAGLTYFGKEE